jgi:hypothetical protein
MQLLTVVATHTHLTPESPHSSFHPPPLSLIPESFDTKLASLLPAVNNISTWVVAHITEGNACYDRGIAISGSDGKKQKAVVDLTGELRSILCCGVCFGCIDQIAIPCK